MGNPCNPCNRPVRIAPVIALDRSQEQVSSMSLPSHTFVYTAHQWRLLFVLLEYFEGLPTNDAREIWLDRLRRQRPALFESLLQFQHLRERVDACGFMRAPPIASALLRMRIDNLTRGSHHDV